MKTIQRDIFHYQNDKHTSDENNTSDPFKKNAPIAQGLNEDLNEVRG